MSVRQSSAEAVQRSSPPQPAAPASDGGAGPPGGQPVPPPPPVHSVDWTPAVEAVAAWLSKGGMLMLVSAAMWVGSHFFGSEPVPVPLPIPVPAPTPGPAPGPEPVPPGGSSYDLSVTFPGLDWTRFYPGPAPAPAPGPGPVPPSPDPAPAPVPTPVPPPAPSPQINGAMYVVIVWNEQYPNPDLTLVRISPTVGPALESQAKATYWTEEATHTGYSWARGVTSTPVVVFLDGNGQVVKSLSWPFTEADIVSTAKALRGK